MYSLKKIILPLCILFSFSACVTTGYFVSPMYGSSTPHHDIPMHTDSVKSASYINGGISVSSNNNGDDGVFNGQANFYRAHSFGHFGAYYGAGLTLGNYTANSYYNGMYNGTVDAPHGQNYFFGSANFSAGVNATIPFGAVGEWRILGINESLQQEFGDYLSFRKKLIADSIPVDGVVKTSLLNTVGFSSELAFNLNRGMKIGGFLQYNILTGSAYKDIYFGKNPAAGPERYAYINLGWYMGFKNYMFYLQNNLGQQMTGITIGMNYRLP
jgi:hypothetical protein